MAIQSNMRTALVAVILAAGSNEHSGQSPASRQIDPPVATLGKEFVSKTAHVNGTTSSRGRGLCGHLCCTGFCHGKPGINSAFQRQAHGAVTDAAPLTRSTLRSVQVLRITKLACALSALATRPARSSNKLRAIHSVRSARIGSSDAALRAGRTVAMRAAKVNTRVVTSKMSGA